MKPQSKSTVIIASIAISLCLSSVAQADVAYSNYGDGWDANPLSGSWVSGPEDIFFGEWQHAVSFTAEASGYVTDLWACVVHSEWNDPNGLYSCEMALMTDDNGLPGSELETFRFDNEVPGDFYWLDNGGDEAIHEPGNGTTYIEAGQTYWLSLSTDEVFVISPFSCIVWGDNTVGDTGTAARKDITGGGAWEPTEPNWTKGAFRIDVTPEPSTLGLLLAVVPLLVRRRGIG